MSSTPEHRDAAGPRFLDSHQGNRASGQGDILGEVDHVIHALLGALLGMEDGVLEEHRAGERMVDGLAAGGRGGDLVLAPELAELRAGVAQAVDELLERGITDVVRHVGTELRRHQRPAAARAQGNPD